MAKTKDLFLNIVANPNMTLEDLASVGLTSENTMLLDRALYASNEKVQDMFRDSEGNFDEQKFNTFYDIAEQSYNILANDEVNLNLMNVTAYDSDNIFVDPSKRRLENKPYVIKLPNPDRLNVGINRIGKIGPRTLSQDEIAQTLQVLLNPVGVANGEKPQYGNAPNESWFEDFWDTRVMAAWDEDGSHIDPVTGKEVNHKKGDLKLNENGTYYYESLDGRSVYGKRILNKFNTLTTDGSSWNKYDFFDSDDIEQKSIGGSVLKNLALVGSMFIPYVGWGVAAASIAHQMAGLTATFGKMLAGSDSPTLDAIEGWVKSTDRRNLKTEYAQQNTWCWENFIDLIGDTTAQLREQRAIFKFAPAIIKGDFKALSDKAMKQYKEKLVKEYMKDVNDVTSKSFMEIARIAQRKDPKNWKELLPKLYEEAQGVFSAKADKVIKDYLKSYYKLGEPIAKAYMTAITVQDTYGEAIQAGASDSEAALLTLGYAAAEAALLSTDLGKWIMPELRTERQRYKMIAKKLLELPEETREMSKKVGRLEGETKKDWAKRLFNIGKDIANAEYSMLPKTVGNVLASGLGEGVEEVSEEALADFSKSCFNLVQLLQGDDVRMHAWNHNWDWSEAANRYGMSFAGGIMGGSINAAASDYKANREILNINSQQAMQQLVYMTRNNELDDFWKVINKTTLASKELSTQVNDEGTGYKPGTKEDNQDLSAKRAIKKQIDLINSIINAENAKLDDSGLLSVLVKANPSLKDLDPVKEYRMRALSNSATAGRFLNEWNTITSDIVKNRMELINITSKYGDKSSEKYSTEDELRLKSLQNDLKVLQERKDQMLDGTRTREYVRDALFEMSHSINSKFNDHATEIQYAEATTGKKYKDLSEDQKRTIHDKYTTWKESSLNAEKIHELADIYETLSISASQGILASAEYYENIRKNNYQNLIQLNNLANKRLSILTKLSKDAELGINLILSVLNNDYLDDLIVFNDLQALLDKFSQIELNTLSEINKITLGRSNEELSRNEKLQIDFITLDSENNKKIAIIDSVFDKINQTYDEFIKIGFIHPESKEMLFQMLSNLSKYSSIALDEYSDTNLALLYEDRMIELSNKAQEIEKLANTPIIENLRQFQTSTAIDQSAIDLVELLILLERSSSQDISELQLDQVTLDTFTDAKNLLEMYRTAIVGARYDNVDLDNIVGFNTTLNEISGSEETPKLAEIDAQTADLILEDINKLLKRIEYAKNLHNLNTGNKYNVQNKTALNKQYIMFNKIKHFVSILKDDDDWKDADAQTSLLELKEALNKASLNKFVGNGTYKERSFTLTPQEKEDVERDSIKIQEKLHNFFKDRIDGSEKSVEKLAKLLTYDNFKGLLRENNDFLNQDSEDIDDSAFIWWLCATAALSPDLFYNNYRTILGNELEGEKPIAPIPTQELGVFALTAAITNGEMFRVFGKAIRKSLTEFWDSKNDTERDEIIKYAGIGFLKEKDKKFFKNNDFLPNFDNIVFIEGIAGSGKSTGVLITLSKLLAKTNPDLVNKKIFIAHTDKVKSNTLGETTEFTNFEAHDHDSLLQYMSPDYKSNMLEDGSYTYTLNLDVKLVDGILRGAWNIAVREPNTVPKLIIIDEWSHYNQLELDLIQRFAQAYGVTVIAMGDYDQLTPYSEIKGDNNLKLVVTPNRNMTPRVAKLGVSMRTDNEVKNGNIYRMLAWRKNPTNQNIELHYYEDENGIYGDKVYQVDTTYGNQLESIKLDVKKMIETLKTKNDEREKIGYIYESDNSELFKWLTTTEGIKEHIVPYKEKDAHGREAQYYIVENNRSSSLDALLYFGSVYTGITRSELGSIVIVNSGHIKKSDESDKYNTNGIRLKSVQDSEMIPNTYTDEGTKEFTNKRKQILNNIYKDREVIPFEIKERSKERLELNADSTVENNVIEDPEKENSVSDELLQRIDNTESLQSINPPPLSEEDDPGLPPPPEDYDYSLIDLTERKPKPPLEEFGENRVGEKESDTEPSWKGPLTKGQKLYNDYGYLRYTILDEHDDSEKHDYVVLESGIDMRTSISKDFIHNKYFTQLPKSSKIFELGGLFKFQNATIHTIKSVKLYGDKSNPTWLYETDKADLTHEELLNYINKGVITKYETEIRNEEEVPPIIAEELDGLGEYETAISESSTDGILESVIETSSGLDFNIFGFTFNTSYIGDEFDDDNYLTPTKDGRIDNGYGLNKINPQTFGHYDDLKQALGSIRKHLYYSSNSDIIKHILGLIRLQEYTGLSMRWAFISKSNSNPREDRWGRYNAPKTLLEYMNKEDDYMPLKTLSAIIYDKYGNPILELPVVCLQSPHSIFRELLNKSIGTDITDLWTFGPKLEKQTLYELQAILKLINTKYSNNANYLKLGNLITMWLFTNNGVKLLPNTWNLHEEIKSLGNLYITEKYSDNKLEHNYFAEWENLETLERKDRFISSILMNNKDMYVDSANNIQCDIFRKYTPYVLISDHPSIRTDEDAALLYLKQLANPTLEKIVKLVPVAPPEVSVSEYIKAMYRIKTALSRLEPYGNAYTSYRIWHAVLNSLYKNLVLNPLKDEVKAQVIKFVNDLDNIKVTNPQSQGESNINYKKRIAKLQNLYNKDNGNTVFQNLRNALVESVYHAKIGDDTEGNNAILQAIQDACDSLTNPKITGVLCKPTFLKNQHGLAVGGFAYKVKTDGKYKYPGYGSFRIFGKIDPPTYNLNNIANHLNTWAKDAVLGKTITDPDTGKQITYNNIWFFMHDDENGYYLPDKNKNNFKIEPIINFGKDLLVKLGINDYTIDSNKLKNYKSAEQALRELIKMIHEKFLEKPGTFILHINGLFKYGDITELLPEFNKFKFKQMLYNQGNYFADFYNMETNTLELIEVGVDLNNNKFLIKPLNKPNTQNTLNVSEIKKSVIELFESSSILKDKYKNLFEELLICYDENSNTVDINKIKQLLADSGIGSITLRSISKSLQLDVIENNSLNNEDMCINPIKINFK